MTLSRTIGVAAVAAFALVAPFTYADQPPVISREVLFGNPERAAPQLSPDATRIAWLAPDKKNVMQVWVRTIGQSDEKMVTADKKRGIRQYFWAPAGNMLIYLQDNDGDENFHVHGVDLTNNNDRDYTSIQGVRAGVTAVERAIPNEILVEMNARDRHMFDVYRLNLQTGAIELDTKNPGDVSAWQADSKLHVLGAQIATPEGGTEIRIRDNPQSSWRTWMKVGPEENLDLLDFAADGKSAYIESSIGADTARVIRKDIAGGQETTIAASDAVDAGIVVINPITRAVEAVSFEPGRRTWKVIDPGVKDDFDAIARLDPGDFAIANRDAADRHWLVVFVSDQGPVKYYSWDRAAKKGTFLFTNRPKLEGLQLAAMKPVVIKTRDNMSMNAYLTLPPGVRAENLPMVLFPHGGPWGRDVWGYNSYAQWLANRGYAVLQPNFRGSTGYGKKFLHAGDRQWGLKMHDDLIDATNWAIKEGYADPKKIAIMGGSYGGYATLAGLTFTPDTFACGVDIVGPSNLKTLIGSIPPYWKPIRAMFDARMGNVDDPKDSDLIRNASPLFKANQIRKPLLIGQGANDPRVNKAESEQIVDAIANNKGSVTYVIYSDEGHGFARPENNIDFNARAEGFLSQCLGGRAEPMEGERYPGSTATVKVIRNGVLSGSK
ncbi:MAG TPA: S9 family peptidase [Thermoanaerobaculia bacterium]|nr:S9 family peptidase [Thermoanaerobaculia bacterium]